MNRRSTKSKNDRSDNGMIKDVFEAVIANNLPVLNSILQKKPSEVARKDADTGMTPLHLAAGLGNVEMVRVMLGIDFVKVVAKDNLGRDPLDVAIAAGHPLIIDMMFQFRETIGVAHPRGQIIQMDAVRNSEPKPPT